MDIKLLDCTLRDGGYVNDWNFGFKSASQIIRNLVKAGVDIVEVGFLRNVDCYNPDITVCNHIEELNNLLPQNTGDTIFSAMAMRSNYDINKLSDYSGKGIEMIRITAHDYDIWEGMDFAQQVKDKGYKLSINPINIMGYSDTELIKILDKVNKIHPYQFSIVDTFGSMKRRDLDRITSLVDNDIDKDIRLALHLHENMAMSYALAQNFIDKHLLRPLSIDGSLMGMGRNPGNLPLELLADYLNDYADKNYDINYLLDAIQDYIAPLKGETKWGYIPIYFLSAKFNLHRNYSEHYLKKGDLTNRDICNILSKLDRTKATKFDSEYADKLYLEYKNNLIDDEDTLNILKKELNGKDILVLAPGQSIKLNYDKINDYIHKNNPKVIAINFVPQDYKIDYAFFTNNKRLQQFDSENVTTITTSNLRINSDYIVNYYNLASLKPESYSGLIIILNLFEKLGIKQISLAGADGYSDNNQNYYDKNIFSNVKREQHYNEEMAKAIKSIQVKINYVTESKYNI